MRLRLWQAGFVLAAAAAGEEIELGENDAAGAMGNQEEMMENLQRLMAEQGGSMGDFGDLDMGDLDMGEMGEGGLKDDLKQKARQLTYNGHGISGDYNAKPYKYRDFPSLPNALVLEGFQNPELPEGKGESGWTLLNDPQYANGPWKSKNLDIESLPNDMALEMSEGTKYYGLAKKLNGEWSVEDGADRLYASVEVKYPSFFTCGGGYFKLFHTASAGNDPANFSNKTPYSIMFGPDVCGQMKKIHLIIQKESGHEKLGRLEFHADAGELPSRDFKAQLYQYGFALDKSTNHVKIYMDGKVLKEGKMTEIFTGGFKSPETIDDPEDVPPEDWTPPPREIEDMDAVKPDDWDEDAPEMIPDTDAEMPEGWMVDEPLMVPNPNAKKPEDWDDAEDGEWIVPLMKNPKCAIGCGEWKPMKKNPDYKGPWTRPMIPNPEYTPTYPRRQIPHPKPYDYTASPFSAIEPFNAVGFELWTVEPGTLINNLLVTTDKAEFDTFIKEVYLPRKAAIEHNKKLREAAQEEASEENQQRQKLLRQIAIVGVPFVCGAMILLRLVRGRKTVKKSEDETEKTTTEDKKATTEEKKTTEETKADAEKTTEETTSTKKTGAEEKETETSEAAEAAKKVAAETEAVARK